MSDIIYLSNVRVSFPNLVEPKITKNDNGSERAAWSADLIVAPNSPQFQQVMTQVTNMLQFASGLKTTNMVAVSAVIWLLSSSPKKVMRSVVVVPM